MTYILPRLNPADLVFVDETFFNLKMARLYGWAPIGARCYYRIPHGSRQRRVLLMGITLHGPVAPSLIEGNVSSAVFLDYVTKVLAPALRPGQIVIMDNLPAHKAAAVEKSIEAVGAFVMFIPPYSPELNAIENAFSKIKSCMEKIEARTWDTLEAAVHEVIGYITPAECRNYVKACGYNFALCDTG